MNTKNKLCNSSSKILDDELNINHNHININQTEINKLRHSLIYSKEKKNQNEKDDENKKNIRKYISMSPKLTLRFNDDKDEGNDDNKKSIINRGFVIKKNLIEDNHKEEVDDNDNKTKTKNKINNTYKFKSKKYV